MRQRRLLLLLLLLLLTAPSAHAQQRGFALNRYNPTPAGEWSFAVDHPWYSATRDFAAGLTLDYNHNPLVFGRTDGNGNFTQEGSVVENQLVMHLDVAASVVDRLTLNTSVPIVFLETGKDQPDIQPINGITAGDPRVGAMLRVYNHHDKDPIAVSFGTALWIPVGVAKWHAGDGQVRVMPKLVVGGLIKEMISWSATLSYLARLTASLGTATANGSTVGNEVQLGLAVGYRNVKHRFAIGLEGILASVVDQNHFFQKTYTSLETFVTAQYNIARQVQVGVAGGFGVLREPGTPDFRLLFRLAYAPMPVRKPKVECGKDSDGDGIPDSVDDCPSERGTLSKERGKNGCPAPADRDHDGIVDAEDLCPDQSATCGTPDPKKKGCPLVDTDHDGVLDADDKCPTVAQGDHPDPKKKGCPLNDTDHDGIADADDQCPTIPMGANPDPAKPGCPIKDTDGDGINDGEDACPDVAGVADTTDPKKHGCPRLAIRTGGQIVIFTPVHFAVDQDVILSDSFPVLQAVLDALTANPDIKRLDIQGHTDNAGKADHNKRLSQRRAKSIQKWLVEHGMTTDRLEAHGFGQTKPIADNNSEAGRAKNRRVEFLILGGSKSEAPRKP